MSPLPVRNIILATLLLILLVPTATHAFGTRELAGLRTLDALVRNGDHAGALDAIARISLDYPELWGAVSTRLETVLEGERKFVAAASEVLAALGPESTPEDLARSLERLDSLSPGGAGGTSARYQELVSSVRELVAYRSSRDDYDRFDALARSSSTQGRYVEAIQTRLIGARELGAGNDRQPELLLALIEDTESTVAGGTAAIRRAERALAASPDTSPEVLSVLEGVWTLRWDTIRAQGPSAGQELTAEPGTGYAYALARSVVSSLEELSATLALRSCTEILSRAEPELAAIVASFGSDQQADSRQERLTALTGLYMTGLRAAAYLPAVPSLSPARLPHSALVPLLLTFQERAVEAAAYRALDSIRAMTRIDPGALGSGGADITLALDQAVEGMGRARVLAEMVPEREASLARVAALGYDVDPLIRSSQDLYANIQATLPLLSAVEETVSAAAVLQAQRSLDALARQADASAAMVRALTGSGTAPTPERVQTVSAEIERLSSSLREYTATWNALAPQLTRRRDITRQITRAGEVAQVVAGQAEEVRVLVAKRQDLVAGVGTSRVQALERVESARTNLRTGKPELATQDVLAAQGLLDKALAVEPSPELLALRDGELLRLYEEAARATVKAAVRQVRLAIDKGREAYAVRDAATSLQWFVAAKQLWDRLAALPNQEIVAWTGLATSAKEIHERLVIPATNPRYGEVQEMYTQALAIFKTGEQALKQSKTRDALSSFQDADAILTRIKRIFPYHRDARALSLKIVQVSDQQRFSFRLSSEIRSAELKIASSPEEAYFDMRVLESVAPQNETVKKRIGELETKLGLTVPQTAQKDKDQSELLRKQAAGAVSSEAYQLLDRAVSLNLTSQAAVTDKDRVLGESDLLVGVILTHEAQVAYQAALGLKASGDKKKAAEIVDGLLQTPRNARFAPLVVLRRELRS